MGDVSPFAAKYNLDKCCRELLSEAYELTRHDLQQAGTERDRGWLDRYDDTVIQALLTLYNAGQRDTGQLARYAAFCAKFQALDS